ncbi:hypothetical protein LY78DRAFT_248225 [Colletotrichum sublineola]|uniref:Uncharacterized protein n=1 Tax=Colletotrichum sublineola TaxID=1173701 RepID=A0A066X7X3_COLSU|nr:hypothetical protein LY78DRAFT_248225 [Colletotrichum sublineola]KDN62120.1 hypothetical protein CSUB01_07279 [Colletotrichum sublineola]
MGSSNSKSPQIVPALSEALIDFSYNMELTHYSDVDPSIKHDRNRMTWEAVLYVRARDVDRLLREGFSVSTADFVLPVRCNIPYPCPDDMSWRGWAHAQQYTLRSTSAGGWLAYLVVGAHKREVLTRFRMNHIMGKMARASVWNTERLLIFHHDAFDTVQQQNNHQFAFLVDKSSPEGSRVSMGCTRREPTYNPNRELRPVSRTRSFVNERMARLKTRFYRFVCDRAQSSGVVG